MISSHFIDRLPSQDVEICVRRFGAMRHGGTPVLFVHGLSYFSYDWVDFGVSLCSDRAGAAMDMRGFGDSSASPAADYTVKTMAADIGHVLDGLHWERTILIAHSMGGRSAACYTAEHPERVKGLVLVDWSPENAPEGSKRVAKTVAQIPDAFPTFEEAVRYFESDPSNEAERDRYLSYLRAVPGGFQVKRDDFFRRQFRQQIATGAKPSHDVDLWAVLAKLSVPTLVLRGTRSDLFAATTVPKVCQSNAGIEVEEIDAGHHIVGDNPAAARSLIGHFINALEK